MVFDGAGNVLQANDGGLARLVNLHGPPSARYWQVLGGNLALGELYSLGYDPLNDTFITGAQDAASQQQLVSDSAGDFLTVGAGDGNTSLAGLDLRPFVLLPPAGPDTGAGTIDVTTVAPPVAGATGGLDALRAVGELNPAGPSNAIVLVANRGGADLNNLTVSVQDIGVGPVHVSFTAGATPTLGIQLTAGTTGGQGIALITTEGPLTAGRRGGG